MRVLHRIVEAEIRRHDPLDAYRRRDREALKKAAGWHSKEEFIQRIAGRRSEPRESFIGYDSAGSPISHMSREPAPGRYAHVERVVPTRQKLAAYRKYLAFCKELSELYHELQQERSDDYMRELTFSPDEIEISEIEDGVYVAYVRGKPVGKAIVNITHEPNHPPDTRSIFKVAVYPEYRRRGVARKLYQRIEQDLRKQNLRLLPSNAQTDDAKAFWKRYRQD